MNARRGASALAATLVSLVLWAAPARAADEPPVAQQNPATGKIEIVDAPLQSTSLVRHVSGVGVAQQVTTLASTTAVNSRPRLAISPAGDSWVVWWRSGALGSVLFRVRNNATNTWGPEAPVGDPTKDNRYPAVAHDGTHGWIAYAVFGDTSASDVTIMATTTGGDDPNPFPTPIASTNYASVDTQITSENGHLWLTWVNSGSDVGWAEYDYATRTWNPAQYESYANGTITAARSRIRSKLLGL